MQYEISEGERELPGTVITLHLNEDEHDFLQERTVREVLEKYCAFMATPIYLNKDEQPINDTHPLWLKNPSECTDEEYKEFYTKVFHEYEAPLFWVHLNVDYPFNLKGILYFPKLRTDFGGVNEGQIKMFSGQVFVADNIKEVIPEFLTLLKGVIDCPDLPLNVSRSFLQNDGYVKKAVRVHHAQGGRQADRHVQHRARDVPEILGRHQSLHQIRLHEGRKLLRPDEGYASVQADRRHVHDAGGIP